jgi:hypothetical protein
MLGPVELVARFNELERELPPAWSEATLLLTVADDARCDRAAALLGPANPGRLGKKVRFATVRGGGGVGPDGLRRLLRRLDQEGIAADLELVGAHETTPEQVRARPSLHDQWKQALDGLPSDWSDLYAEIRFDSTDFVEPGALQLAPANPARSGPAALRFRCAHHFGYGVSPEMATRCFERCDAVGLTGVIEILHALSDTNPVGTQGPVWLIGGRAV